MLSDEEMRDYLTAQKLNHLRWQMLIKDNWLKKHHPDIYKAQHDHLEQTWVKKQMELVGKAFAAFLRDTGDK